IDKLKFESGSLRGSRRHSRSQSVCIKISEAIILVASVFCLLLLFVIVLTQYRYPPILTRIAPAASSGRAMLAPTISARAQYRILPISPVVLW
ncbi:MAG: hypothetical protein SOR56_03155, partial [Oscillospiraceae bacterium]|nr:hypothetical protein [Oscillospiraceae bacterium]